MSSEDKHQKTSKRAPDHRLSRTVPHPLSDLEKFQKIDRLNAWHIHKKIIATTRKYVHNIKPGEVYWVTIGENIGSELNGKGNRFTRPVLVFKLEGSDTFFGLPLTHGGHQGKSSIPIKINNQNTHVALSQGRTFSILRAYNFITTLPDQTFTQIKIAYKKHLFGDS